MKNYLYKNYKYVILTIIFMILFSMIPSILEINYRVKGVSIVEFIRYIFDNRFDSNIILNFIYQIFNTKIFLKILLESVLLSYLFYLLNNFYKTNIIISLTLFLGLGFRIILNVLFTLNGVVFYVIPLIMYIYLLKNIKDILDGNPYNFKHMFIATIFISLFGKYFAYLILVTYIFFIILSSLCKKRCKLFFIPLLVNVLIIGVSLILNYNYYTLFLYDYNFFERISYNLFSNYELIYQFFFDKIFLLFVFDYFVLKRINSFNLIGKINSILYTIVTILITTIYIVYRDDVNWIIGSYITVLFIAAIILIFVLNYHFFKESFSLYIRGLFLLLLFLFSFLIYTLLFSKSLYGYYLFSYAIFILYLVFLHNNIKLSDNIIKLFIPFLALVSFIIISSFNTNRKNINDLLKTIENQHEYLYIYTKVNIRLFNYYNPLTDYNNLLINLVDRCDSNYIANIIIGVNDYEGLVYISPTEIDYYYKKEDIPPYFIRN